MTETSTPTRRLRRSATDRRLAGVAGGIGEYLGIDPVIIRIAFVVTFLAGGFGLIAYLAAWILVPEGEPGEPGAGQPLLSPETGRIVAGVLLVTALVLALDDSFSAGDLLVPMLLIGGGAWLLWRPRDGAPASVATPVATPAGATTVAPPAPTPPPPPAPAPAPTGPPTGRITLAVVLVALGGLGVAAAAGVDVTVRTGLLVALGCTTVGLLVGAITGRARGLIGLAVPLVLVLSLISAIDLHLEDGIGERTVRPATIGDIEDRYVHGVGAFELDLDRVPIADFAGTRQVIEVRVGVGEVVIDLPEGLTLEVDAEVGAGELTIFGARVEGTSLDRTIRVDGPEGAGTIVLRADVGVGEVTIR